MDPVYGVVLAILAKVTAKGKILLPGVVVMFLPKMDSSSGNFLLMLPS